ncbi:tripartite tricarboxylate transporter TctB family protein [Bacillus sp. SG-1]|uniref:tripartite tricarboxylate transporter TctB family protein n=1 Tax=Bacillus sp. SG-1 TaxID=161544 RepID=UPI0001543943|nr:tripartite tricarboxylate transporter TctB family protein [Bacillus sp. SG-1]EDL65580.1 hypothetical protein BSG1_00740 [Bacillus sp. SG-1]
MEKAELKKDFIVSVSLIVISIVLYATTYTFKRLTTSQIGPQFAPRLVTGLIFALSVVLLTKTIINWKKAKINQAATNVEVVSEEVLDEELIQKTESEQEVPLSSKSKYVLYTLGLILIYIIAMSQIGFLISTSIYLFAQICLFSEKKYWNIPQFAILSIVVSVVTYFSFRYGFNLMLPGGILG